MSNQVASEMSAVVRNLGGIDSLELRFEPGVTLLTGRNATNRTSLLQSIAAGLGGSYGELKGDAEEGAVELRFDGDRYTRQFERANGVVRVGGDPYTDEDTLVDLFSCLLESNPARRAVERGDGDELRDVLMRPVDTDAIEAEIESCRQEVTDVENRIEEIERRRDSLPELEERKRRRQTELDELEAEIDEVRAALDEYEADVGDAEAAEAVIEDLQSVRNDFEAARDRAETQRNALESLRDERETVRAELADLTVPESELDETRAELERLQGRERRLENTVNNLVSILEFNETLLEQESEELPLGEDGDTIGELDPASRTVECWTCGTRVDRGTIADRLDDLRATLDDLRAERRDLSDRIDDCRREQSDLREAVERRDELDERLDDVEAELEDRESRLEELEARTASLREEVEELEAEAAESEGLRDSDLLERYQRLSELEYERGQLAERLASTEAEIEEVSGLGDELDELRERRGDLRGRLDSLRTRVEDTERSVAETFNGRIADVVDLLGYGNIERVWIERKTTNRGGRGTPESTFDLHIVRTTEEGTVYEDTVDHLSESEREVIGLVVALTGYLVHDVYEQFPVMLLDSLEAIDADRIATLVEYFAEYAPFLVVALLPGDAEALPDRYRRVEMNGAVA